MQKRFLSVDQAKSFVRMESEKFNYYFVTIDTIQYNLATVDSVVEYIAESIQLFGERPDTFVLMVPSEKRLDLKSIQEFLQGDLANDAFALIGYNDGGAILFMSGHSSPFFSNCDRADWYSWPSSNG